LDNSLAGYEELDGGHFNAGEENSRMCMQCTFSRLMITSCAHDEICQIEGMDPDSFDDKALWSSFQQLSQGDQVKGKLAKELGYCCICPAPAFYRCCAKQMFDKCGEAVGGGDERAEGCGLLLCDTCWDLWGKVERGGRAKRVVERGFDSWPVHGSGGMSSRGSPMGENNLDAMIRIAGNDKWIYSEGLRADVAFLTSTGELLDRMRRGMGQENHASMEAD
jgi:hypothetical protein